MTFQRAPPEVNGFGVTTDTPGLTRSSQVRMCFGLPGRTTKTTTDFVTKPLYLLFAQFLATILLSTSSCISGASDRSRMSACRPLMTASAWVPEAPYDWENETPLPA